MLKYDDITPRQQDLIDALYGDNVLAIAPKGIGKCVCGQTAAQELLQDGEVQRVLVLAPLKVCQLTWAKEHRKWEHLSPVGMVIGTERERIKAIEWDGNYRYKIVVMNFENVAWFFERYGSEHGFDGLLIDESTKLKTVGGTGYKALRKHLEDFTWRALMTADPVAEQGTDIYGQALLVDGGKALGRNQDRFRRKYFYPLDFEQRRWGILPGMEDALAKAVSPVVQVIEDQDYLDTLPPVRDRIVNIELDPATRALYEDIESPGLIRIDGVNIEAASASAVAGKQSQISAGAVYDNEKPQRHHWVHTDKYAALKSLLKRWEGESVAVVYWYQFEKEMLKHRYPHIKFLGDAPEKVEAAWNDGSAPLIGVHPGSCSHGLNLQYGGSKLIFLTAPWSADHWEQIIGRFRRRGQEAKYVERAFIVAKGTRDEECLARHEVKAYASEVLNTAFAKSS